MKPSDLMSAAEVLEVTRYLRALDSDRARGHLALWWLSTGAGLRVGEIVGLEMRDVLLGGSRPTVRVRPETSKSKHGRDVPLWWNPAQLPDLAAWLAFRHAMGDDGRDAPVVCGLTRRNRGKRLTRHLAARHWLTAIKPLGPDRQRQLHIHCGRHTFASHALASGRTLVQVARALGHRDISTTTQYLHIVEPEGLPSIYAVE